MTKVKKKRKGYEVQGALGNPIKLNCSLKGGKGRENLGGDLGEEPGGFNKERVLH